MAVMSLLGPMNARRGLRSGLAAAALLLAVPAAADPALAAVPEQFRTAFNRGDAAALGALFAADADFVNIAARHVKGAEAIASHHAARFAGPAAAGRLESLGSTTRPLSPGTALVLWRWRMPAFMDGKGVPRNERIGLMSFVMREAPGGWRIASAHNSQEADVSASLAAPPAAPARPPGAPAGSAPVPTDPPLP